MVLANCLLEDERIDYTTLHLNDQTCRGEMDNVTHMVTFGFDTEKSCGTLIMVGILCSSREVNVLLLI